MWVDTCSDTIWVKHVLKNELFVSKNLTIRKKKSSGSFRLNFAVRTLLSSALKGYCQMFV